MTAAIDHLHANQPDLVADDRALAGVAPVTHAHINSLGRYELNRQPRQPASYAHYASLAKSTGPSSRRRSA